MIAVCAGFTVPARLPWEGERATRGRLPLLAFPSASPSPTVARAVGSFRPLRGYPVITVRDAGS